MTAMVTPKVTGITSSAITTGPPMVKAKRLARKLSPLEMPAIAKGQRISRQLRERSSNNPIIAYPKVAAPACRKMKTSVPLSANRELKTVGSTRGNKPKSRAGSVAIPKNQITQGAQSGRPLLRPQWVYSSVPVIATKTKVKTSTI